MNTVLASLASTLGVVALVAIVISLSIWIVGLLRRDAAAKSVKSAEELLEKEPRPEIHFQSDLLERFSPKRAKLLSRPWMLPLIAGCLATVLSIIIGTRLLYVPMVSDAYRELYHAYCRTDAVVEVLSRRVADRNLATISATDACVDPSKASEVAEENSAPVALNEDDAFFLIDALGLRDPREKTKAELFATGDAATRNHELAIWLTDPKVYSVGTPTSLLLLRIAGKVQAGHAVAVRCQTDAGGTVEATQNRFKTAVLAAVLAQQPDPTHPEASLGNALLGAQGPLPLKDVVPYKETDACDGDIALGSVDLGPSFHALLLEKPVKRLTEAQIISLVLGWSGWKPAKLPKDVVRQDTAIAFMEAITSEAEGTSMVRDAKIAANFFIGWERLAILCIVPFLGLCLLWQQWSNNNDARHLHYIKQAIDLTTRDKVLRALSLAILAKRLYRSFGRSGPREILVAALEVHEQILSASPSVDFDRVHRVSEHEMRIMDRSRFFFLAGLPLLPTIGFVGTVRSLIEALALADRIPRARTTIEQVAAVSDVTSTLSLCFSTTFMALGALLIFAPLDLWQATRERRVLEETERLLDPGL